MLQVNRCEYPSSKWAASELGWAGLQRKGCNENGSDSENETDPTRLVLALM
jgi:hypothetical protein